MSQNNSTQNRAKRRQSVLLSIVLAGLMFVIIPAVLFANSQDEISRSSSAQTIPTRTPVLTPLGWMPIILNESEPPPTPTFTPTVTPTSTSEPIGCSPLPNPMLEADNATVEDELASEINSYRAGNSLSAYVVNDHLVQAARRHAHNMATLSQSQLNSNPHLGTDGTLANQRITEACYQGTLGTEIVGWGFTSVTAMMEGFWKTSSVHNGLLLDTQRNEYGPTYLNPTGALYDHYWVVTFGSSASATQDAIYHCTYVFEDTAANTGMSVSTWQETPCRE